MKKILALALALMMMLTFVACGEKTEEPKDNGNDGNDAPAGLQDVTDAPADILNNIWAKVPEDKKFSAGDGAMLVEDDLTLVNSLYVPEAETGKIDSAARLMHMMMANNFTSACYRLKDGTDVEAFGKTMRESLIGTEWMCGFPEKLYIAQVGNDSLIVIFGVGELMAPFTSAVSEAYSAESVKVLYDEVFPGF